MELETYQYSSKGLILNHGSLYSGIWEFGIGGLEFGEGFYATTNKEAAFNYARKRLLSNPSGCPHRRLERKPTNYQVKLRPGLNIADFSTQAGATAFLKELLLCFGPCEKVQRVLATPALQFEIQQIISAISGKVTALLLVKGFHGLYALDKGELPFVRPHDSFVLFDPSNIVKVREETVPFFLLLPAAS